VLNLVNQNRHQPELSVVLACYCEEATLDELHSRLIAALDPLDKSIELIYINDGSTDRTLEKLLKIHGQDSRVMVIDLVRNGGQWPAMTAGICHARGRAIAFLDSDLQLDPADLPSLLSKFDEGYELVSGCRTTRQDTLARKAVSRLGNFLLQGVTKGKLHDLGCSMKVFDASHIRAFDFGPMMPFRPLQVVSAMSQVAEVPVTHRLREYGESSWGGGVLIKNFSLAALDLLQGRMRVAGVWTIGAAVATGVLTFLLRSSGLHEGVGMGYFAVVLFVLGQLLIICDLLILSLVTRRVKPAYIVRKVYGHRYEETKEHA